MTAPLSRQFTPEERKALKRGHQIFEPNYSGVGFTFAQYPWFIGTLPGGSQLTQAVAPETQNTQAQPDADSPITGAAEEAGATTSGGTMAANTAPAGA
jgi:hypothetical protein